MKENIEDPLSPEEIAARLGLGYSWFRRMFKGIHRRLPRPISITTEAPSCERASD